MKNLRYVIAQQAIPYFSWQIETQIHNLIKNGVNPNNIDYVCAIGIGQNVPDDYRKLADTYNSVRFFFYECDAKLTPYVSVVRPNILKKHFAAHPELEHEAIFYMDSDVIFTRPPDWTKFLNDEIWRGSDTQFYIGAQYIIGKGHGLYEKMCEIVGIDQAIPLAHETNSIGAQYLMHNVNFSYWEKVEKDAGALYEFLASDEQHHPSVTKENATPENPEYNIIQRWTSDMWSVLWNAWYFGHETLVEPEFDFVWGTQSKEDWDRHTIFHGAGILNTQEDMWFYKGSFTNKLPYDLTNYVDPKYACHYWLKEILETGEKSCLK